MQWARNVLTPAESSHWAPDAEKPGPPPSCVIGLCGENDIRGRVDGSTQSEWLQMSLQPLTGRAQRG
ncbi:unnamed protein product [Protopolystoma xenopodis]|uniref:Uncharacterized protein n=1 Tax=Protopolystoma xenopodis TaxID=117903 RepID=A0A3S5B0I6_9PLAT|nr:unnamed protein product [Protopolystoma xenopodis]